MSENVCMCEAIMQRNGRPEKKHHTTIANDQAVRSYLDVIHTLDKY